MKIDITDIAGKDRASKDVTAVINPMDLEHEILGIALYDTISLTGRLTIMQGYVFLSGQVEGKYRTSCHRCLAPIEGEYHIELDEKFELKNDEMDDESYLYDGHSVDLTAPLLDNILLSFPTIVLCQENCKGLCPGCGKDLNKEECTCEEQEVNLKMEKLKDFFNK